MMREQSLVDDRDQQLKRWACPCIGLHQPGWVCLTIPSDEFSEKPKGQQLCLGVGRSTHQRWALCEMITVAETAPWLCDVFRMNLGTDSGDLLVLRTHGPKSKL